MRVWVDLTNSPHVLVMRPIVRALEQRGAEVLITARDFAQTLELCERHGLACEAIGRHRGGRLAAKGVGLLSRSTALLRWARGPRALRRRARRRRRGRRGVRGARERRAAEREGDERRDACCHLGDGGTHLNLLRRLPGHRRRPAWERPVSALREL